MTQPPPSNLQRNLERLRLEREWDRTELAKRSRVSLPYVSQLLSGQRSNPRITTLRKLAKALRVSVKTLQADPPDDSEAPDVAAAS